MKTIGLIGGMSWESSLDYYRIMNETIAEQLGGLHSAKCILYSLDFEEIGKLQNEGDWDAMARILIDAAKKLETAGADTVLICTNTMHKLANNVQDEIDIPLLHIADVTAKSVQKKGFKKVGLLGTKFTMEDSFYTDILTGKYGLEVVIPDDEERQMVHDVIFNELCVGQIKASSKEKFIKVIDNLAKNGAQGVILGCTEIPSLIKQEDSKLPVFDTTTIHAKAAVDFALE